MIRFSPPVLGVDISKWQRIVGGDYEYPVFTARAHSGYSIDPAFVGNARVIDGNPGVKVRAAYVVPVAGMDPDTCVRQTMSVLPPGWCVMIDEESGAGFHGPGDHSAVNNDLRERFIRAVGGNRRAVWGYANGYDWASNWPDRGDTPMVVAKYSAFDNDLIRSAQVIGWQYSNGQASNGVPDGYPRGSRAVGNCDMNVYGFPTGDAFAAWIGGHSTQGGTATPIEEDDMQEADFERIHNDLAGLVNTIGARQEDQTRQWIREELKRALELDPDSTKADISFTRQWIRDELVRMVGPLREKEGLPAKATDAPIPDAPTATS